MKKNESVPLARKYGPSPVVIPLSLGPSGTRVFDGVAGEPNGFILKAHFFIQTGCFVRARLMLELVQELGEADEAVLVTLASLQIREGLITKAAQNLEPIRKGHPAYPQSLICKAELERSLGGLERAMNFCNQHPDADLPEVKAHLDFLQSLVIT